MTDITTGTEAIRAELRAWQKKTNISQLATNAGVAVTALEEFIASRARLNPEVLENLANILWDGAVYDRHLDLLVQTNRGKTKSLGVRPPPAAPGKPFLNLHGDRQGPQPQNPPSGPRPSGRVPTRPGFARD